MGRIRARFVGVELYFENLERAKTFYQETMGLEVSDEQVGHHAKFDSGAGFVCLERKGAESYPSKYKAVLFFEVLDLKSAIAAIGQNFGHRVALTGHKFPCLVQVVIAHIERAVRIQFRQQASQQHLASTIGGPHDIFLLMIMKVSFRAGFAIR